MTIHYAKLFLNKVIEENDVTALVRHNITVDDMYSEIDRKTYEFIREYAEENGDEAPSYAVVADSVEDFEYIPEVSDSYAYLARQIKSHSAKQEIIKLFDTGEFERRINEMDGLECVNKWLPSVVESVKMRTDVRDNVGTDIKRDGDKFLEEYRRRKLGESFRVWESKFDAIGEYVSSNLYTVYGKSGRGKSVITLEDAIHVAKQGANVLIWAMEMGNFEVLVRAYTSLSGDAKIANTELFGANMDVGFDSRDIRFGQLDGEFEKAFEDFVRNINVHVEGNIVIRAADDEDFRDRSLDALRADIERTEADFVVIDPFYYLDYERNTSRTAGGDAAATSMKLRRMAGTTSTTIVAITQADESNEESNEEGTRELIMPDRNDVKKTKQLLEDSCLLIGIDSDYKQGRGIVGVNKGRDGGEGDISEFIYAPQYGVVKPLETGKNALEDFNYGF